MPRLILVRHGQASLFAEDYDKLSETGVEQARRVGAHLAERGVAIARVLVGPRVRHHETLDALRGGHASSLPDATQLDEFDEHAGALVVARLVDQRAGDALTGDPTARATAALAAAGGNGGADIPDADRDPRRAYLRAFTAVLRRWSRGELEVGDLEPWRSFRTRVERGIRVAADGLARGDIALVVTSGGPVAASVGFALGTSDERTMELSWGVANTGVSEFLYSPGRTPSPLMLASYNVTAHLEGAWLTYV